MLVLAGTAVDATIANAFVFPEGTAPAEVEIPDTVRRTGQRRVSLRTPTADPDFDLPPPPSIEANTGQEAEGVL